MYKFILLFSALLSVTFSSAQSSDEDRIIKTVHLEADDVLGDVLQSTIDEYELSWLDSLIVTGVMTDDDFPFIVELSKTMRHLQGLNLSEAYCERIPNAGLSGALSLRWISWPTGLKAIGGGFINHTMIKKLTLPLPEVDFTSAFHGNRYISSVVVPEGYKRISKKAFCDASNLTEVVLPSTLETISEEAFENANRLSHIDLPNSITQLSPHCFRSLNSCEEIELPDNIEEIPMLAFAWCTNLSKVKLPKHLKRVKERAFAQDWALLEVELPSEVEELEYKSFDFSRIQVWRCLGSVPPQCPTQTPYSGSPELKPEDLPSEWAVLHIPAGTRAAYEAAPFWKEIKTIIEDIPSVVQPVRIQNTPAAPLYDLQGRRVDAEPQKGIYIRNGRKVVRTK